MKKLIITISAIIIVLGVAARLPSPNMRARAADPCAAPDNQIVAENCLPGNPPSEWDISGIGDQNLQGFATRMSVNRGETIAFKVDNKSASNYRIDIYRLGYYSGLGARKVATIPAAETISRNQPACLTQSSTGLVDCGNWSVSATWDVPASATSGIYIAKPVREDTGGSSHIIFIVRNDASTSDLLFQTSDTTWQAYNTYGGNSFYIGGPGTAPGRAYKLSYNRPFVTRAVDGGQDWLFNAEVPMVRWLEANGYDVSYFSGVDSDQRGNLIQNHQVFLSVGHDEYWSKDQRANVEAARDAGVHLAFFSGNEVYWKVRWEHSIDGSGTPYRTLVTYKESHNDAKIDPSAEWTGLWRDPRFSPPSDGGHPENALTGQIFGVNDGATTSIRVPAADGQLRFWRNTSIATLSPGTTATLPFGTLGYEWDVVELGSSNPAASLVAAARPAGLLRLSTTTVHNTPLLRDYGSNGYANSFSPGSTATHHLTLYRHSSGALVFGAGTVQWSWGLDSYHDRGSAAPDPRMQQATVNLFADMGVQPATLQSGLVPASASTDTTAPASTITSPADGATVTLGTAITISGTATDTGGGVVGGVEVSVDGGTTWNPAQGRANWSYIWRPDTAGTVTIRSRAVDDSGNIENPSVGIPITVGSGGSPNCPCNIWDASTVPALLMDSEHNAVEVGVKFRTTTAGTIRGIRFYKGPNNTGTHVGNLWASNGTLLASATFTNETNSGWQEVQFATPVAISANTTYVASYHAPNGRYSIDENYFTSSVINGPLQALQDGVDGGNGVYRYGATSGFPTSTYRASNYWVDVVFTTDSAPTGTPTNTPVSTSTPTNIPTNTPVSTSTPTRTPTNTPVSTSTPTNIPTGTMVTSTPTNPPTATNTPTSTPAGSTYSLWDASSVPAILSDPEHNAVELGVKFRVTSAGTIQGLRFYKGPNNTGTHVGNLWASDGTLLASATFTNETSSGWQEVQFATPVAISANTTYVASYHAPNGRYSIDENYFTSSVINGPLQALQNGVDGGNGVYRYGATSGFPTSTYRASNYWVDVIFAPN